VQPNKALAVALIETSSLVDERFDGYQKLLIQRLRSVIQAQDIGGSNSARRGRVEAEVSGLADKVADTKKGSF
jgi:hypothetical protein